MRGRLSLPVGQPGGGKTGSLVSSRMRFAVTALLAFLVGCTPGGWCRFLWEGGGEVWILDLTILGLFPPLHVEGP